MKLVILDRDGVVNEDSDDYIKSVDEFHPYPNSVKAIGRLSQAGYLVAIATNQSGIGRGFYDRQTLEAMQAKLAQQLAGEGGVIDYFTCCPHLPDDGCECRKPKPGMLIEIKNHYQLDSLDAIHFVGDSTSDLIAARAAGATPVLVRTGKGERTIAKGEELDGVDIFDDLNDFVEMLLDGRRSTPTPS